MTLLLDASLNSKITRFVLLVARSNVNIKTRQEIEGDDDEKIENIVLPAFIPVDKTKIFVTCGLCNVVRQLVKHSVKSKHSIVETPRDHFDHNSEDNVKHVMMNSQNNNNDNNIMMKDNEDVNVDLLLGYKQNCLKACSAVSCWTNFCEKDFPDGVCNLIINLTSTTTMTTKKTSVPIPKTIIQLEKEFTIPKKTANAQKHQLAGRGGYDQSAIDNSIDFHKINDVIDKIGLTLTSNVCCVTSNDGIIPIVRNGKELLKRKNQIFWPYICGLDITIADLLVLGFMMELLNKMSCFCVVREFFMCLPNIFRWFSQCISKQTLLKAITELWPVASHQQQQQQIKCPSITFCPIFNTDYDVDTLKHITFEQKLNTKHMHAKITKNLPSILEKLSDKNIKPLFESGYHFEPITWHEYPVEVNPVEGELNSDRAHRKRLQIDNLVSHVLTLLKSGDKLVDFCAGGGHLGIVIAYLRRDVHVVLLENKEESIERALKRIEKLGLENVSLRLSNLEYFDGKFDVGVALHACGSATDLVLSKCIKYNASFVICPCCYGGILASPELAYPKSQLYNTCGLSEDNFVVLSHSADQTSTDFGCEYSLQGKHSMLLVDHDRTLHAEETGRYKTQIFSMIPETCSPKNNIIVGRSLIS